MTDRHTHIVTFDNGTRPDYDAHDVDTAEHFPFKGLEFEAAAIKAGEIGVERICDHGSLRSIDPDDFDVSLALAPDDQFDDDGLDVDVRAKESARIEDVRQQSAIPDPAELGSHDGRGFTLCVMDSGVDSSHTVFDDPSAPITHVDATDRPVEVDEAANVPDNIGHGSACAGQAYRIAPSTEMLSLRVFKSGGGTTGRIIMRALDWIASNRDLIDVVNMSWGVSKKVSAIDRAHDALVDAGLHIVSAAGNSGGQAGSPATADTAFSVGATTEAGTVADFSSYNPDDQSPDVAAIGAAVRLIQAENTSMGLDLPGPWVQAPGTSFSSPEVAGMLLLYLTFAPEKTPQDARADFRESARDLPSTPRDGAGIADCSAAVELVSDGGFDQDESEGEDEDGSDDGESGDSGNENGRDGSGDGSDGGSDDSDGSGDESDGDDGTGGSDGNDTSPDPPDEDESNDQDVPESPDEIDFNPPEFSEAGTGQFVADLMRVVDGDTMYVDLALTPFDLRDTWDLRLLGIDTAEIFGVSKDSAEYERGVEHRQFVRDWFSAAAESHHPYPLLIKTNTIGKYGRKVSIVKRRTDGSILNVALIEEFGDDVFSPQDFTNGSNAARYEATSKQLVGAGRVAAGSDE